MNDTKTTYFVRSGTHQGKYLKLRERGNTTRKYSWTNQKYLLHEMSYDVARKAIVNTYGGTLVKRVYRTDGTVAEQVIR